MRVKDFLAGLYILRQHYKYPEGYHLSAEHDVIHLDATDKPLDIQVVHKLKHLGWFQEGIFEEDGEIYDPKEPWSACT